MRQTAAVSAADVVLYEKGFQPSVDSAVKENARDTLEVGSVVDLERTDDGVDPHFWHDPARMADYADAIGDEARARSTRPTRRATGPGPPPCAAGSGGWTATTQPG